jgi:hypothetical protein
MVLRPTVRAFGVAFFAYIQKNLGVAIPIRQAVLGARAIYPAIVIQIPDFKFNFLYRFHGYTYHYTKVSQ